MSLVMIYFLSMQNHNVFYKCRCFNFEYNNSLFIFLMFSFFLSSSIPYSCDGFICLVHYTFIWFVEICKGESGIFCSMVVAVCVLIGLVLLFFGVV